MLQYTVSLATSIPESVPAERLLSLHPRSYQVKGLFFTRYLELLGSEFERIRPQLEAPPRFGRYLPFSDYPQIDLMRVVYAVASKHHPRLALAEAIRRVARDDFGSFAESRFGRIALNFTHDIKAVLLRFPDLERVMSLGPVVPRDGGGNCVLLEWRNRVDAVTGYMVGVCEGLLLSQHKQSSIHVKILTDQDADYEVRWS
jgi:uncharacterized protein (TIGR02265 family)